MIEKALSDYHKLVEKIVELNRVLDNMPTLEALSKQMGAEQYDEVNGLFDVHFGNIYVTIYELYSPVGWQFGIGDTIEIFDNEDKYIGLLEV